MHGGRRIGEKGRDKILSSRFLEKDSEMRKRCDELYLHSTDRTVSAFVVAGVSRRLMILVNDYSTTREGDAISTRDDGGELRNFQGDNEVPRETQVEEKWGPPRGKRASS